MLRCVLVLLGAWARLGAGAIVPEEALLWEGWAAELPEGTDPVVKVKPGATFTQECSAFGVPAPSVTWHREGSSPPRPSEVHLDVPLNAGRPSLNTATSVGLLRLPCLAARDAGVYVCRADNGRGLVLQQRLRVELDGAPDSAPANLAAKACRVSSLFTKAESKPRITQWTETRLEGPDGAAQLLCRGSGTPQPRAQWFQLGEEGEEQSVEGAEGFRVLDSGDLMVSREDPEAPRIFRCRLTNKHGHDQRDVMHVQIIPQ